MDTINSDVLVVGAGLAGFTAAVRASEEGANVVLIDKSNGELGDGNVLMASGSLRAGGKSPKADPAELYEFVMTEGIAYPDLVRAWADNCGRGRLHGRVDSGGRHRHPGGRKCVTIYSLTEFYKFPGA